MESPIFITPVHAKPENLSALLQRWTPPEVKKSVKKSPKKKAAQVALGVEALPLEYWIYFEAKAALEKKLDLKSIESLEKRILEVRLNADTRALEKEFDELFYALEIKRAERQVRLKSWRLATRSFTHAMNALHTFKWIYYWRAETSDALVALCTRKAKVKDDACPVLAKRVVDAFPKSATETKVLRDLPAIEASPLVDVATADRLSQPYPEKTEQDEEAFADVLDDYLNGKDHELFEHAKLFMNDFPKSILRFRALFLMAEFDFKFNRKKDAKEKYDQIISQIPLSYYAVVAAERNGVQLRDQVKKDMIKVDLDQLNLQYPEKQALVRAESLYVKKHYEEVALELETLTRVRAYNLDTILYVMGLAHQSNQDLTAFRIANELIQRKYDGLLANEFLEMIFPDRYSEDIELYSKLNKIDPLWVMSLMKQESGFKAPILSSSGAMGLMQLMPFTALDVQKDVLLSSLKQPSNNISIGTKYIASLAEKYNGNMVFALAAYNAGPNRVAKWKKDAKPNWGMTEFIESIPYKETRDYVMSIFRNHYWYQYRKGQSAQSVFDPNFDLKRPIDTKTDSKTDARVDVKLEAKK